MKKYIAIMLSIVGVYIFSIMPFASAQINTTETVQTKPTTTIIQRIEEYKKLIAKKLTTAEQTRLKSKCKAAQAIVTQRQKALDTIGEARMSAYNRIDTKLIELITKLDKQGIDVSKLKEEQTMLASKIASFKTDLTTYKQSIADTAIIDCVADPTAFKAALLSSRDYHKKVGDAAKDIRIYITETIIPTINDIKTQLGANSEGGNQ